MGALTEGVPKPLLEVAGRPILAWILSGMARAGVGEAVIVVGYRGAQIQEALGSQERFGLRLSYRVQERPEGTARALLLARDALEESAFVLSWGDVIVEPDTYGELVRRFASRRCDALLAVNEVDDPWRGAAVYVDGEGRVRRIVEKPARGSSATRWNNAGLMVLSPKVFPYAQRVGRSPRGEHELPEAIEAMVRDRLDVRAFPVQGLWSDVGTPEDLRAVDELLRRRAAARRA